MSIETSLVRFALRVPVNEMSVMLEAGTPTFKANKSIASLRWQSRNSLAEDTEGSGADSVSLLSNPGSFTQENN